ncbi:MAG: glycosyltransferase [Chloroflexota bacterium]
MRILYLSRSYTPHDHRFLSAMVEAGHEAAYLCLDGMVQSVETRPLPDGVHQVSPFSVSGPFGLPWQVAELRRLGEKLAPDVVHAGPVQSAAFRAALAGLQPLVTMSWGSDLLMGARRGPGRWLARYALRHSDVLVCDCQTVKKAAEALGMPGDRIVVFPWGVDLEHFHPGPDHGLRSRLGWQQTFVLLSTRSWEPIYGIETLLAGFVAAACEDASLRLLMLGDGSLRPRIEAVVRRAGIADWIHFAGRVAYADLPKFYRASDLYLSASRSDGSSVSLLEAMACGLPAVVSDIAGNREWVEPGVTGWWFRDGEARALREAILFARAAALPPMGEAARAVVEARADWRRGQAELMRAYALACSVARSEVG